MAELPIRFLAGCRWALYAETLCGPDGLQMPAKPHPGSPASVEYARVSVAMNDLRKSLGLID